MNINFSVEMPERARRYNRHRVIIRRVPATQSSITSDAGESPTAGAGAFVSDQ